MATVNRAVAALRIRGEELQPEEITRLLGASPSSAYRKGDVLSQRTGRVAKFGMWCLEAQPMEPSDFNAQVASLLDQLPQHLDPWALLAEKYEMDIYCGWFMEETSEGEGISAATLLALGARHIGLGLDIYAPVREPDLTVGLEG